MFINLEEDALGIDFSLVSAAKDFEAFLAVLGELAISEMGSVVASKNAQDHVGLPFLASMALIVVFCPDGNVDEGVNGADDVIDESFGGQNIGLAEGKGTERE